MASLPIENEDFYIWPPHVIDPYLAQSAEGINWSTFLHRSSSPPSRAQLNEIVAGKTILITGAGGSIGSSLVQLLMTGSPKRLLLLDHSQDNLGAFYQKCVEQQLDLPEALFIHGDILNQELLEDIFFRHEPNIVFHVAGAKHLVPLEWSPFTALENNVAGTLGLLRVVNRTQVEHFINISSDKAVDPTSVLGVSKRITELLLLAGDRTGLQRTSLRLGNVLESSGSVVPIFLNSLRNRFSLTVTHQNASRYFLTLQEAAASLVNSLRQRNDRLLLPEMGNPQLILDLAKFLIGQSSHDLCDDPIVFVGLRDGEKCSEDLTYEYEHLEKTSALQMHSVRGSKVNNREDFADHLGRLLQIVRERQKTGLIETLVNIVPEFTPSLSLLRHLT